MNIYAKTQRGKDKEKSDDRIVVGDKILCEDEIYLENVEVNVLGIADGVGGNLGGDIAAEFVCERIGSVPDVYSINNELIRYSSSIDGKKQMATAFSGIIFSEHPCIVHIGNTRIYKLIDRYLKQITSDHTTYNWFNSVGRYEEAEKCNKSEIISCFGGGSTSLFKPEINEVRISGTYLLTSDGVHDYVDIDIIEECIAASQEDKKECCDRIIQTAVERGSCDDISVILFDI